MKKVLISVMIFATLVFSTSCGSVVKYKEGDKAKSYMQGVDKILVKFDYSAVKVGKFATEAEYMEKRMAEIDEKEPGKGDEWKVKWEEQKDSVFAHQFIKLMSDRTNKKGIQVGTDLTDAPITVLVNVVFIEPGWNIGISRRNAEVNLVVEIYKTGDMQNPLAVYEMKRLQGVGAMGFDFDAGYRIGQSFARGGRELGKFLAK